MCLTARCRRRYRQHIRSQKRLHTSSSAQCAPPPAITRQSLLQAAFPSLPWEKVGFDLFHYAARDYLMIVDHFSHFIAEETCSTTSGSIIEILSRIFAIHGIPAKVVSDNGPQFASTVLSSALSLLSMSLSNVPAAHVTPKAMGRQNEQSKR